MDLDDLLDSALDDFDTAAPATKTRGAAPNTAQNAGPSSSRVEELAERVAGTSLSDDQPSTSAAAQTTPAFDPLRKRPPTKAAAAPKPAAKPADGPSGNAKGLGLGLGLGRGSGLGPRPGRGSEAGSSRAQSGSGARPGPSTRPAGPSRAQAQDYTDEMPPDLPLPPELAALLKELGGGELPIPGTGPFPAGPARPGPPPGTAATLAALAQQSGSRQAPGGARSGAEGGAGGPSDDLLASLLKGLGGVGGAGGEGGGGGGLESLVDGIMQQLLSKEVLCEPLKDIGARFPGWLEQHRSELPPQELARYEAQYVLIQEILEVYETTPEDFPRLVKLMQEMQSHGQPPPEIVEEMAPGLGGGGGLFGDLPNFGGGSGGGDGPPDAADLESAVNDLKSFPGCKMQ